MVFALPILKGNPFYNNGWMALLESMLYIIVIALPQANSKNYLVLGVTLRGTNSRFDRPLLL
jgi:hypothetical protein